MALRLVFMGTPQFAVPCLRALAHWNRDALAGVISQPDKPQGRGMSVIPTPVKQEAMVWDLPVFQPAKARNEESQALLRQLSPDLIVVVAYGQILPRWFLEIPPRGCLNVHASLLPLYRGGAPLQRAVLNGEKSTGVTLMLMDEGMDTGPILSQRNLEIEENETSGDLAARAAAVAAEFLVEQLPLYLDRRLKPRPQDSSLATNAPLLKKEEGAIAFGLPAGEVHNRVRAMNPWPIAFCGFKDDRLLVHRTRLEPGEMVEGAPGQVLEVRKESILVACGNGAVSLTQVQIPGRRIAGGGDFANGARLKAGFIFQDG
jgi:methionyl-tRNA formyltransferase